MLASLRKANYLGAVGHYLTQPVRFVRGYDRANLRPDLTSGITLAVVLLPQAIAFALIADLPPRMGLYTAIVGGIIGALWGASHQLLTGPTNALSLLVFSALSSVARSEEEFIIAAGMMAVMAGGLQLVMGLARLGVIVNFVSYSVVVGFSTGAGLLIAIKQLSPLLGIPVQGNEILQTVVQIGTHLTDAHVPTAILGLGTILFIVLMRRINQRLPEALIAMIIGSLAVFLLKLDQQGVKTIGELPKGLPPFTALPVLDLELVSRLSTGALAVGAIGLVQTSAIARSFAARTGQRLDNNQEFVGQGMANILSGFFGGYSAAGSFSLSALNFGAGARSGASAVFASVFVLFALLVLGPLAAFLPKAALSGVLMVTAYRMIDYEEIRRIWRGTRSDAVIMTATLLGTLFLELEFAVLLGIMLSFAAYIRKTSLPQVYFVRPDEKFRHFAPLADSSGCPQLGVLEIHGDLYFGAVNHVEEVVQDHIARFPDERFLLIRMHSVNHVDFSGIHALEHIVHLYRDRGGDVFIVRVHSEVMRVMEVTGFAGLLREHNFLDDDSAISDLFYHTLDPAVCIYECPFKVFRECQNLPKYEYPTAIPAETVLLPEVVTYLSPRALYSLLRDANGEAPLVFDVREPREYRQGHIPQAVLRPLVVFVERPCEVPADQPLVLVCRTGRRSRRVATMLAQQGFTDLQILTGGMLAWEAEGLLEAVDYFREQD